MPAVYHCHKLQKKREYGEWVREVELASFTPFVFGTTGRMGKEAVIFTTIWLIGFLTRVQCLTAALWLGFAAHNFFIVKICNHVHPENKVHLVSQH